MSRFRTMLHEQAAPLAMAGAGVPLERRYSVLEKKAHRSGYYAGGYVNGEPPVIFPNRDCHSEVLTARAIGKVPELAAPFGVGNVLINAKNDVYATMAGLIIKPQIARKPQA